MKQIPVIPKQVLYRNAFKIKRNLLNTLEEFAEDYGNIFALNIGKRMVIINEPNFIKHVTLENHTNYIKGDAYNLFHPIAGQGLLTSDGQRWKNDRKVLNLEFKHQSIENHFRILDEEIHIFHAKLAANSSFAFSAELNTLLIRTICRILFNFEVPENLEHVKQAFCDYDTFFGKEQRALIKTPFWMPRRHILKAKRAINVLHDFCLEIYNQKCESEDDNMLKRLKQNGYDQKSVCEQIVTLFVAGHETTVNSLLFTLLLLRDHPAVFNELKETLRNSDDRLSMQEITKIPILDGIIKESLRLYPTIPVFARTAVGGDQLGEFEVKQDDLIGFSPWVLHRRSEYWDAPTKFAPERFSERNTLRDSTYIPFGFGPRRCIGEFISNLQMKAILYHLIKDYDFEIVGPNLNQLRHNISLAPAGPITLSNLNRIHQTN